MKAWTACVCTLVALAAACERVPTYKEPAEGSYTTATYLVRIGETSTPLQGAAVTKEFFPSGGAPAMFVGRPFIEADYAPSSVAVVILSHDLWKERFGETPVVLGQQLEIAGRQTTIVAVAPPGFAAPSGTRVWVPRRSNP